MSLLEDFHPKIKELVVHKDITKFFKKTREIRINYVTAICDDIAVPIYYYSEEQYGYTSYIDYTMKLDTIRDLDNSIIDCKIQELQKLGLNITSISLTDNLHTHPVGCTSFSSTDYNGCLKPDYTENSLGTNMLFSFTGEIYKTIVREQINGEYKYYKVKPIEVEDFTPYIDIKEEHFKTKALTYLTLNQMKQISRKKLYKFKNKHKR